MSSRSLFLSARSRRALWPMLAAPLLLLAWPVQAFHSPRQFVEAAGAGGADGILYTGSPASQGLTCSTCHTGNARGAQLSLQSDPASLFVDRAYEPGAIYDITIRLENETRGLESLDNFNTFALELLDAESLRVPGYFGFEEDTLVVLDDALVSGTTQSAREWNFSWEAPVAGTGHLDFYLAAVDGNGADSPDNGATDPEGDTVMQAALRLAESGVAAPPFDTPEHANPQDVTACNVREPDSTLWVLGALGWVFGRRRGP